MKSKDLSEFYYMKINFCGCGQPWKAMQLLYLILKLKNKERWDYIEVLLRMKENPGVYYTYLYWLESLNLSEHGGNVSYGWLTAEGIELMEALKKYGYDPDQWDD